MRRLAFVVAAACLLAWGNVPAKADLLVSVNIFAVGKGTMTVVLDQHVVYRGPVATAMPGYVTPTGVYRPTSLKEHHVSSEFGRLWRKDNGKWHHWGAPMDDSTFFVGGKAIHLGSPYIPSHGCIHSQWAKELLLLIRVEGQDHTLIHIFRNSD